jgi:hypothetical protein
MAAKTIAEKLQIKPNSAVWLSDGEMARLVEPLPEGARLVEGLDQAGVAVVFVDGAATTRAILDANRGALTSPSVFWVAYPKGNRADINRDTLWPILTDYGMRPNGQVAVDEVWSALRFRPLKEGEAPFTGGS